MKKVFCLALSLTFLLSTSNVFADTHNTYWAPPGLVNNGKLPKGLEKKFEPFAHQLWDKEDLKEVFEALKELLEDYDDDTSATPSDDYYGTFESFKNNNLKININDKVREFDVHPNVKVLFDNQKGSLSDLQNDDLIEIQLNTLGAVNYIRVFRDLKQLNYTGDVMYLEEDDDLLVLEVNNNYIAFELDSDLEVVLDGYVDNLSKVQKGDTVIIALNDKDKVERLEEVSLSSYRTYEGIVVDPYERDSFRIIEDDDSKHSFQVSSNFKVQFKDRTGTISDVKLGDPIKISLDRDRSVISIEVDRRYEDNIITGKFVQIYENTSSHNDDYVVIDFNDTLIINYLDNTVDVYINDIEKELSDLEKDDEIRLELRSNTVEVIRAYR